jgi:hypothetical protein
MRHFRERFQCVNQYVPIIVYLMVYTRTDIVSSSGFPGNGEISTIGYVQEQYMIVQIVQSKEA